MGSSNPLTQAANAVGNAIGGDVGKGISSAGNAWGQISGGGIVDGLDEALTGRRAKERALDAAKEATARADAAADTAWGRQQQEMEPWRAAGAKALTGLQDGSFFQKDPGYQFRLDEGNKGINAAMAARGMGNSGAALKSLSRYGQDYASNEYQNAYNRQNNLVNYGNQASMALGNFAGGHAANISNNSLGYGNAVAGAELGQANRNAQLLGGLMSAGGQAAGAMFGKKMG